ncbi:MAG: DUF3526 domain-containing protein [Bacteroidota bacterium]
MWQIIRNEWLNLRRTNILVGISLGFALILLLSVLLSNYQNKRQIEAYKAAKDQLRAQWENIEAMNPHGAAHYGTYVFKPSNLLSSLDEGVNSITGNVLRVEGHVQNEMVHSEASQMQAISRFGKLQSSLLLKYILPLLLIFLAFSSFSREKQSGRLKLLVLQGAKPQQLIFAKSLAVWLFGLSLLALVFSSYAVLNLASLNADILARSLMLFGIYALYYFILSGLSVFFSSRWQNPTLALTSMLGLWILWTVFLPNILLSSIEQGHPLPSRDEFKAAMKEDRAKGIDGHNPADERGKALEEKVLAEYGVDSLSQLPINFDGLVMQADEEYGNQVWDKHFGQIRELMGQQKRSLQLAGFFNPFISLQNASKGFAATDNLHHQDFLVQVETYRRGFIKSLNDEHAFGGSKTGDWGWEADNAFYRSIPDFAYQAPSLKNILPQYTLDLGMLLFWAFLTLALLFFSTKKIELV